MKLKRFIRSLCTVICFCLLLCGCGKTAEPSLPGDSETSGEQSESSSGMTDPKKLLRQTAGGTAGGDFAGKTFWLTPDDFDDFFHYRFESTDQGDEYDILTYSLGLNAASDDICPYIEGIMADVSFDMKIRYAKEYTDGSLLYDTFTYSFQIKGSTETLSGTVDIPEIPVFKRSETDTAHKKFTVLDVAPNFANIAGVVSYTPINHTYKEAVTYDTVPDFEIAAKEDCIAVYMVPGSNHYLYDGLAVEIELRYTYDTSDRPDQYVRFYEERITVEGNLGGYGQYIRPIENGEGKITKATVSVVGISGSVIRSKGYTVFDYPVN